MLGTHRQWHAVVWKFRKAEMCTSLAPLSFCTPCSPPKPDATLFP